MGEGGFCRNPAHGDLSAKRHRTGSVLPYNLAPFAVRFARTTESLGVLFTTSSRRRRKRHNRFGCVFFVVGGGGFEPPKSETSDLQSDAFGHSAIRPNIKF